MKIKDLPEQNRPRERFLKFGAESLSDAELFAILLRTGTKQENIIEVSNRLIAEYGLDKLFDCSLKELEQINGIGPAKAMQILTIAEIMKRKSQLTNKITKIKCAKDVYTYFYDKLKDEKQEYFYVLMLNTQHNIIKEQLISKGVLDASIIHPREIFKPAIKNSSSKIIIVHNHPSGNPNPSEEDLDITNKLVEAGNQLDIKVLDHVIVAKDGYWSWQEKKD